MRVEALFIFTKPLKDEDTEKIKRFMEWLGHTAQEISNALNGNLSFGDGTSLDNIAGKWVTIADTGLANTDFTVAHGFGQIPPGFLLAVPPAGGFVYKGATAWTTTNIYLRCSVANQAVTVFVLASAILPS